MMLALLAAQSSDVVSGALETVGPPATVAGVLGIVLWRLWVYHVQRMDAKDAEIRRLGDAFIAATKELSSAVTSSADAARELAAAVRDGGESTRDVREIVRDCDTRARRAAGGR